MQVEVMGGLVETPVGIGAHHLLHLTCGGAARAHGVTSDTSRTIQMGNRAGESDDGVSGHGARCAGAGVPGVMRKIDQAICPT